MGDEPRAVVEFDDEFGKFPDAPRRYALDTRRLATEVGGDIGERVTRLGIVGHGAPRRRSGEPLAAPATAGRIDRKTIPASVGEPEVQRFDLGLQRPEQEVLTREDSCAKRVAEFVLHAIALPGSVRQGNGNPCATVERDHAFGPGRVGGLR